MYWSKVHISEGLRFPLAPLVHQFFHFTHLYLIHTHVNMICVLLGVCVLRHKYDVRLGLEEVLYAYSIKRHKLGRNYLISDALQLVTNLPNTSKNKPQGNVLLFGVWGCERNPVLREFRVNANLDSGLVQGSKPYSIPALMV